MTSTFRLGRIAGVSIGVSWTLLIIVWLLAWSLADYTLPEAAPGYPEPLYWIVGLAAACGLVASILVHELSHAVVARRHDVPVDDITLWMFGGLARLGKEAPDAASELRIAVVGPAASIGVGGLCLVLAGVTAAVGGSDLIVAALAWLGGLNLILAVFNLLPGAPLDGGRVLTAVLWRRSGNALEARRKSAAAGRVLGQVLIGLGIVEFAFGAGIGGLWLAMIGWFLTTAAHGEQAQTEVEAAFAGVRVGDVMTTTVVTADGGRTVADFIRHDAATSHVATFPIVGADGRLEGLVTLRRLRQLAPDTWQTSRLRDVAIPLDRLTLADPGEPLIDTLRRAAASDGRILVMADGHLVGIVTPSDVTRALEARSLVSQS